MRPIRVAAAVVNQTPLDWDGNRERLRSLLAEAREQAVSVLCLPELCLTGYGCEDAFLSPGVWRTAWALLEDLLPDTRGLIASFGLPVFRGGALFNAACLAVDGRIAGFTAKRFLAGDGIHYEPRWFKAWPVGVRADLEQDGRTYPFGDLIFDCGGLRIGFEICEDAWVANRPGAELARRGCDVILNPSASHFAFGKLDVRRRFVLEGSRAFAASYVYSNLLGNESGRAIYDGGALIASAGRMLAEGPRFSFAERHLATAVVDVDATRATQARTGSFRPDLASDPRLCVHVPFELPGVAPEPPRSPRGTSAEGVPHPTDDWEGSPRRKCEEFARAEALALFDYLRKSGSHGFAVSLSGGADSAAVALLVALSVRLGWHELGREAFLRRLAFLPGTADVRDERDLVRRLLLCVYQATRNSSAETCDAARTVAEAIGARFLRFDVDPHVELYLKTVGDALGRVPTWETDDVALQNVQARVRAPGIWMLANIERRLLLATSNRSEAAVGYCTMDGDTCGSLSPIAGIDKHFLRQWLRWMEQEGPRGLGAEPALAAVNRQQPTAELRPPGANQTDEGDLMPYDLLDFVERAAIRDKQMPLEVLESAQSAFPQHPRRQLAAWVERFFRLWCRNQWKRERYAPSFHLDDENLDPKTWCRFPILSGGFERELAEMRCAVESCADGEPSVARSRREDQP